MATPSDSYESSTVYTAIVDGGDGVAAASSFSTDARITVPLTSDADTPTRPVQAESHVHLVPFDDAQQIDDAYSRAPPRAVCATACATTCTRVHNTLMCSRTTRCVDLSRLWFDVSMLLAAALFAISGSLVGTTHSPAYDHSIPRSLLYFGSVLLAAVVLGRATDAVLFWLLSAFASMSQTMAYFFFYASAFRECVGQLMVVVIGLSTYDYMLNGVTFLDYLRLGIVACVAIVAIGARRLLLKLVITDFMRQSFSRQVTQALLYEFMAAVMTAPDAYAPVKLSTDPRLTSPEWRVLCTDDFRAQVCRLARTQFAAHDHAGRLTVITDETTLRASARAAFYRLATSGVSAGPPPAQPAVEVPSLSRHTSVRFSQTQSDATVPPPVTYTQFSAMFGHMTGDVGQALTAQAWMIATADQSATVSIEAWEGMFLHLYRRWCAARKCLEGHTSAHKVLDRLSSLLMWIIVLFVACSVFDVSLAAVLMPLGTITIAISFAIGGSVSALVQGLIFTLVMRPFDVDDHVIITASNAFAEGSTSPTLRVLSVDVLTSTFQQPDGRRLQMPTSALAGMSIVNTTRSDAALIRVPMKVEAVDIKARLEALRRAVREGMASAPFMWQGEPRLLVTAVDGAVCGDTRTHTHTCAIAGARVEVVLEVHTAPHTHTHEHLAACRSMLLAALAGYNAAQ